MSLSVCGIPTNDDKLTVYIFILLITNIYYISTHFRQFDQ